MDEDGRSPLHCVVGREDGRFVHLADSLMENEADPEARDAQHRLAVEAAIEQGADDMAALIVKNMSNARFVHFFFSSKVSSHHICMLKTGAPNPCSVCLLACKLLAKELSLHLSANRTRQSAWRRASSGHQLWNWESTNWKRSIDVNCDRSAWLLNNFIVHKLSFVT